LGHGDGTFAAPVNYEVGVEPAGIIVGSFSGTGALDIAVANSFSNSVSVLLSNGDGTFQTAVDYAVGVDPRSLVAADFNGDGALDLAVANDHSNDVSVLFNQADGLARAKQLAAVDALFAGAGTESPNPVSISQEPPVGTSDGASSAGRMEALTLPKAHQTVADSNIRIHPNQQDRIARLHNAELDDPLSEHAGPYRKW
jgi:hypothetical protein